ncbi:hypothetical protein [Prosthecobacter sp.]|uniref:hypothetical protein n=1 Tax=Prosthecobacter sp. TaxID=1965333 RepID=UPI00378321E4
MEPPELIFAEHTDSNGRKFVGLGGWDQLFRFAMENDAAFLTGVNVARQQGLSEMDTLKLIASQMTLKAWKMQRLILDHFRRNGIPFNTSELAWLDKEERDRDKVPSVWKTEIFG